MAKIQVFLHGQLLSELLLESGQIYYAGRGSTCQILLANERGMSRQHIKFYQDSTSRKWVAHFVAKFGALIYEGRSVDQIELDNEIKFSVPPYEFQYHQTLENIKPPIVDEPIIEAPEISISALTKVPLIIEQLPERGNLEATVVGQSALIAYLKIYNNKTKTEEILKLEGHVWIAGRNPSCDIIINDSAFSRKHFDITRSPDGFYVTDHESSNGTMINGEKIEARTPHKIVSGDVLTVKRIEFFFELHDGEYKNKINDLVPMDYESQSIDLNESGKQSQQAWAPAAIQENPTNQQQEVVVRMPSFQNFGLKFKINKIHAIIGVLSLVLVYGLFFSDKKYPSKDLQKADRSSLSPDKKKEIADTYNLAHNYYTQRKFVMCVSQVEKLHSLVPFYQDSKELDNLCRQAQELEQIELDRKRKEDERLEVENKIRSTVDECKTTIKDSTSVDELNLCLQAAIQLDPQNGMIGDLQNQVKIKWETKNSALEKAQDFAKRKQDGLRLFSRAVEHFRSGELKMAYQEFRNFVNGKYPGLNQKEDAANRNLASIKEKLDLRLNEQITKCQSALDKADLKGSIKACDQVLKEDQKNEKAKEIRSKAFSQLKKEMKALYDDASLEESLGNIEAAKAKWSKIVDNSIPEDDYLTKAKKKLSKYGIGN